MTTSVHASPIVAPSTTDDVTSSRQSLMDQYQQVRRCSEQLCEPLVTEDYVIQSMPDVSPTKWHLAHTSWFFETFILASVITGSGLAGAIVLGKA